MYSLTLLCLSCYNLDVLLRRISHFHRRDKVMGDDQPAYLGGFFFPRCVGWEDLSEGSGVKLDLGCWHTHGVNAVWICQLCDTVYIHMWSVTLQSPLWCHFCGFQIYTVLYSHPAVHLQWRSREGKCARERAYMSVCGRVFCTCTFICVICAHVYMTVFQRSWVSWCVCVWVNVGPRRRRCWLF